MESNVTTDARDRVMNTLVNRLEDHKDVIKCTREDETEINLVLDNTKGAIDTYNKVYNIFQWLENERLDRGYFLYNSNGYTVDLDENHGIQGREKKDVNASLVVSKMEN